MIYDNYYYLGNTICSEIIRYMNMLLLNNNKKQISFNDYDVYVYTSDFTTYVYVQQELSDNILFEFGRTTSWENSLASTFSGIWCRDKIDALSPVIYTNSSLPIVKHNENIIDIDLSIEYSSDIMFSLNTIMDTKYIELLSCWFGLRDSGSTSLYQYAFNIIDETVLYDFLQKLKNKVEGKK